MIPFTEIEAILLVGGFFLGLLTGYALGVAMMLKWPPDPLP